MKHIKKENPERQIPQGNKPVCDLKNQRKQPGLYDSAELFGERNEIMIRHEGEIYRIRITRNGKLVMNK